MDIKKKYVFFYRLNWLQMKVFRDISSIFHCNIWAQVMMCKRRVIVYGFVTTI